jgi:hypothetical protein
MPVSDAYAAFVNRTWQRIEDLTGHKPFYVDRCHIASYCPRCLDGTVSWRFIEEARRGLRPEWTISSQEGGPGHCSHGCTEREVAEVIA